MQPIAKNDNIRWLITPIHTHEGFSTVTVLLSSYENSLVVVRKSESRNQRNALTRHASITLFSKVFSDVFQIIFLHSTDPVQLVSAEVILEIYWGFKLQ